MPQTAQEHPQFLWNFRFQWREIVGGGSPSRDSFW